MITLEHLVDTGEDFGIHCQTREEARVLVGHIYDEYPTKQNGRVDMFDIWDHFKENTVIFPNILNCNWSMYGRLGGNASRKRKIYEFSVLKVPDELPIEQSDMDISLMLGL